MTKDNVCSWCPSVWLQPLVALTQTHPRRPPDRQTAKEHGTSTKQSTSDIAQRSLLRQFQSADPVLWSITTSWAYLPIRPLSPS